MKMLKHINRTAWIVSAVILVIDVLAAPLSSRI